MPFFASAIIQRLNVKKMSFKTQQELHPNRYFSGIMIVVNFLSLSLVLPSVRDAVADQCWQGVTYSETVVSSELRSSSVLHVPEVESLAQCAGACCDLPGCDVAWFFERHCYVLSCHHKENCQPKKRPGTDSRLSFLKRGPTQMLLLQSLVHGEPFHSRWRPLPRYRGQEDPLKDLALLKDIQKLDNSAVGYADSYRNMEDRGREDVINEDRSILKVAQEEIPDLLDWPALQERFNNSKVETVNFSLLDNNKDSMDISSSTLGVIDGNRTSSLEPTWRLDEENHLNISFTSEKPAAMLQVIGADPSENSPVSSFQTNMGTTTETTSVQPETVDVSIESDTDITLPKNTVELTASVASEAEFDTSYTYRWSVVSSPNGQQGVLEGKHNKTVRISEMSAGVYIIRVSVTGKQVYGESVVNITVHPEVHQNIPPKSVAMPKHQNVSLASCSNVFINGSQSTDDTGIVSYLWEQLDGPLWESRTPVDMPVLILQNCILGEFRFRLTVTDSEGLFDSTTATVTVSSPTDEPPIAAAGTDLVISLPLNHITLWGNQSTDDHAITSYLWRLHPSSSNKSSSMQGVRSPVLRVSDLQEGQYSFQLIVTDSSGQQDTDTIIVTVLPENRPPVAVPGPDMQFYLPVKMIKLNGSDSTDDQIITSYQWEIVSGPPGSKMRNSNKAVALVSGLKAGSYKFMLTVHDQQGAADSAITTVTVKEATNQPLIAHASGSHTLTLPNNSLVLRGSVTNSGFANISFLWVRDDQSPAAGDVLYGSTYQACLYLANLVEGTYLFQLRVTDNLGRSSTATATVEVCPDPREREEVELELQVPVAQISQQQKETVVRQLAALLHVLDADIAMKALHGQSDISTVFRFSVQGPDGTIPGPNLARLLKYQLLKEKNDFFLFKVLRVDTVMCLLLCSGHGQCNPITRGCMCDPLWMENPFRHFLGDENNCDWSVLYVTICSIVVIIFLLSTCWAWCKRGRSTKIRNKTKYTILDNMDEQEQMELQPKYNIKHRSTAHNSSLMISESDCDSDQDTVFSHERNDRARNRVNGSMANRDVYNLSPVEG